MTDKSQLIFVMELSHGRCGRVLLHAWLRYLTEMTDFSAKFDARRLRAQARVARADRHRPAVEHFEAASERVILEPPHRLMREEGEVRKQDHIVAIEKRAHRMAGPGQRLQRIDVEPG